MKKILFGFLALSLLTVFSCKKAAVLNGGTFTFKGTSYSVTSAIGNQTADNTLVCVNSPSGSYNDLLCIFYSNISGGVQIVPYPKAGTYTIVAGAPADSSQISFKLDLTTGATYNGKTYLVDPATSANATVTTDGNGWLKISVPSINLILKGDTTGADHGSLSASVVQTSATE
jgi:hypothetical protein